MDDTVNALFEPVDTDEDGTPDYLDLDSNDDGIPDSPEAFRNSNEVQVIRSVGSALGALMIGLLSAFSLRHLRRRS